MSKHSLCVVFEEILNHRVHAENYLPKRAKFFVILNADEREYDFSQFNKGEILIIFTNREIDEVSCDHAVVDVYSTVNEIVLLVILILLD